jgi:hypothetical protein
MTSDAHQRHETLDHLVAHYSRAGMSRRQFMQRAMAAGLTAAGASALFATVRNATAARAGLHGGSAQPDFGPNVTIFDPSMPSSTIQSAVNAAYLVEQHNQFGSQRYAFLFKPGTYNVNVPVGYYTSVAGLGLLPDDVNINGQVRVEGQGSSGALINFWRSVENLSITIPTSGFEQWAVSQAAPFRRMHVRGRLFLFPFGGFSSGGYIADSQIDGLVINASQQQWLTRDSVLGGGWSNGVWNQVFSGVVGAPAQSFPNPPYTTLPTSPLSQEKPFLYVDSSDHYNVFVPALRHDAVGTTWANGPAAGSSIPIEDFFIAKPTDAVSTINAALASDQNLILTPGVYHLDRTIEVKRPDTVVLGLGFPTLVPDNGIVPMTVADVKGVKISGLLFDAGPVNSPLLLQVGTRRAANGQARQHNDWSDPADPTLIQDVFFRIGGAALGMATTSLEVNSDNVLIDDVWAWRADHGTGVGWTSNTADSGVVINGDNVTAYGLFVEHYQKYDVIWNGENGRTIFFQNEMPYDPPTQADWSHDGVDGYAAYKVADSVTTHEGWGLGSYCFFNVNPNIMATRAFEVPDTPGVRFHDLVTVSLGGVGTIEHVVNNTGAAANKAVQRVDLVSYP